MKSVDQNQLNQYIVSSEILYHYTSQHGLLGILNVMYERKEESKKLVTKSKNNKVLRIKTAT